MIVKEEFKKKNSKLEFILSVNLNEILSHFCCKKCQSKTYAMKRIKKKKRPRRNISASKMKTRLRLKERTK